MCGDRPDKEWRRFPIGISLNTDKFFMLPSGKSLSPFKFDALKSYVEDILGPLCIGLKAAYSEEVFSTFFSNSNEFAACNMSFSFASVLGASDMIWFANTSNMKNIYTYILSSVLE